MGNAIVLMRMKLGILPPNLEGKGSIQWIESPVHGPFLWNAEVDVTFRFVFAKARPKSPVIGADRDAKGVWRHIAPILII